MGERKWKMEDDPIPFESSTCTPSQPAARDSGESNLDSAESTSATSDRSESRPRGGTVWGRPEWLKTRRLAADSSTPSGSSSFLLFSVIPLLFLVYWFFSRRFQTPTKRSRKQSTYRCHYPENAEDFSDVEPEIDMV